MGFLNDPAVKQAHKKWWFSQTKWYYEEDLVYIDKTGGEWIVPAYYVHEVSIPRPFQLIIPPTGPYSRPAALHDFTMSDKLFLEAMYSVDMPRWLAKAMYFAVTTNDPDKDYDDITASSEDESILG